MIRWSCGVSDRRWTNSEDRNLHSLEVLILQLINLPLLSVLEIGPWHASVVNKIEKRQSRSDYRFVFVICFVHLRTSAPCVCERERNCDGGDGDMMSKQCVGNSQVVCARRAGHVMSNASGQQPLGLIQDVAHCGRSYISSRSVSKRDVIWSRRWDIILVSRLFSSPPRVRTPNFGALTLGDTIHVYTYVYRFISAPHPNSSFKSNHHQRPSTRHHRDRHGRWITVLMSVVRISTHAVLTISSRLIYT